MDDSLKKLKKLASLMKKEGILTYKTPEIELHLAPNAITLPEPVEHTVDEDKEDEKLSSEDVLLWSAPGMDA